MSPKTIPSADRPIAARLERPMEGVASGCGLLDTTCCIWPNPAISEMRFVRRYEVTRLHDKVTIPSRRNVLLFVRGDRPAGRVVEGDAGHEPAIEEALLGAGAFGGVDSGAKRNRFKRSGFERLCQAL